MEQELEISASPAAVERPCCVRALEVVYLINFVVGLAVVPPSMMMSVVVWLGGALLAILAVSRFRLALAWLGMSACCIGFLIFIPVNAAFYLTRMEGDVLAIAAHFLLPLVIIGLTLMLLWSRKTTDWIRAGGGKLSMLVI